MKARLALAALALAATVLILLAGCKASEEPASDTPADTLTQEEAQDAQNGRLSGITITFEDGSEVRCVMPIDTNLVITCDW